MKYKNDTIYLANLYINDELVKEGEVIAYLEDEDMFMTVDNLLAHIFEPLLNSNLSAEQLKKEEELAKKVLIPYHNIKKDMMYVDTTSIRELGSKRSRK